MGAELRVGEAEIPECSIFVAHDHLHHAGAGWNGSDGLQYHTYRIPEKDNLKDAVAFSYFASFGRDSTYSANKIVVSAETGVIESKVTGLSTQLMMRMTLVVTTMMIQKEIRRIALVTETQDIPLFGLKMSKSRRNGKFGFFCFACH